MHYVFRYWYSLEYSNAYLFINVVVIVFILCSDPVYSMSSFVFCFQFYLMVALSCVICVIRLCMLFVVLYCITTAIRLAIHLQQKKKRKKGEKNTHTNNTTNKNNSLNDTIPHYSIYSYDSSTFVLDSLI
jgi:uncharacterized membrane protein